MNKQGKSKPCISDIIFILILSVLVGCGKQTNTKLSEDSLGQERSEQNNTMIGCQVGDIYYIPQMQLLKIPANEMNESMGWIDGSAMTENYLYYVYRPTTYLSPFSSDGAIKLYRVPVKEAFSDYVLSGAYPTVRTVEITENLPLPEKLLVFGMTQDGERGEYIQRFFTDEKGQLYFVCASTGQTQDNFYHLYRCDAEGNIIEDMQITEALVGFSREEMITENYLNKHPSVVDEEGNIYLTNIDDRQMWILNPQGELLCTFDFPEYELESLMAEDGKVYGVAKDENHNFIVTIDVEAGEFKKMFDLPKEGENAFLLADRQGGLFCGNSKGMYECSIDEKKVEKLFDWVDMGVNGKAIQSSALLNFSLKTLMSKDSRTEDFVSVLVLDSDNTLTLTTQIPAAAIPAQREQVVLGVLTVDSALQSKVAEFNKRSFYYEVEIKEYGIDNGAQRLETEIVTGKGPDLFPLTAVDVPKFLSQGLFSDLSPFLRDGKGLEKEDLVEEVLRCHTQDGILVCVPSSFSLDVLTGRASMLPVSGGWTIEEYLNYVDANQGAEVVRGAYIAETEADAKTYLADLALNGNINYFANWEKGEAYFDSQEFLHIMQFARDYHADISSVAGMDVLSLVWDGRILLYNRNISQMNDYLVCQTVLEGDAGFIGYPTADGSPCYGIYGWDAYGIQASSEKKDGAWAFIEFLLTSDQEFSGKNKEYVQNFPTMEKNFDSMLKKSMIKQYQKNEMGEFLRDENGNPIEIPKWSKQVAGERYDIYAAAEEDVAAVRELVEKATFSSTLRSSVIYQIVTEELIYYMDGQKTAEQTVEIIQNRVQLFLDEQK